MISQDTYNFKKHLLNTVYYEYRGFGSMKKKKKEVTCKE